MAALRSICGHYVLDFNAYVLPFGVINDDDNLPSTTRYVLTYFSPMWVFVHAPKIIRGVKPQFSLPCRAKSEYKY